MLIADRFRLVERISYGTFADVWKAVDTQSAPPGRLLALKLIRPSARGDSGRPWEPVLREVEASLRMGPHPHVLTLWAFLYADYFPEQTTPCLAMELIDGWNLAEWLLQVPPPGPDSIAPRLTVMGDVLKGLAHAHRSGVIHGDLSFGNVLIRRPHTGLLTDFGSAHIGDLSEISPRETHDETGDIQPINPPPYDGSAVGASGARRDVYAFATLCYLALIGRHPLSDEWQQMRTGTWTGAPCPHQTIPRRPLISLAPWMSDDARYRELSALLLRCLAPNPDDRPATADVVLRAWNEIMG